MQEVVVLHVPTPEHPAQTQLISVDRPAGTIHEQEWSGMITTAHKGRLIERTEALRRALKAALHRANAVELPTPVTEVGRKLFDFVLAPV